jgi:hypothetical protein
LDSPRKRIIAPPGTRQLDYVSQKIINLDRFHLVAGVPAREILEPANCRSSVKRGLFDNFKSASKDRI